MRAFIAIPLSQQVKDKIEAAQDRLRKADADVRWVRPANIHITLKFLGNIEDTIIPAVKSSLSSILKSAFRFELEIKEINAFPNLAFPRTIWAGIGQGQKECMALQKDIEQAMEKLGIESEARPFSAHLTLGRIRSDKNRQQLIDTLKKEKDFDPKTKVSAGKIVLFQSLLNSEGPIYTALEEFLLA